MSAYVVSWYLPIKTVSEANYTPPKKKNGKRLPKWLDGYHRHKLQQQYIRFEFLEHRPKIDLPCIIELTRIGPKTLDDDNLRMAFKWIRDQIAASLFPGSRLGQEDCNDKIIWQYSQLQGPYGVRIVFASLPSHRIFSPEYPYQALSLQPV